MRVGFTPGAVFRVPAGEDFAYAVMLAKSPYIAFYDRRATFDEAGVPVDPPMFVLLVERSAYVSGGWGGPIRQLPDSAVPPIPRFSWQSVVNKADCKIVDPGRSRVTASPADCMGLEPEAIWSSDHITSRVIDTYAGRPNVFLESLRVKL